MADASVFEWYTQEALRLRAAWSEAGVDFFQYLVDWEKDESKWKGDAGAKTGYSTFPEVLHATNITKPHRLSKFKELVSRFGLESVRAIGIDAAEEAMKIPEHVPSRREPNVPAANAVVRDLCDFRQRNSTPPSTMTARSNVRQHYEPPTKEHDEEPTFDDRVKELEHENAQLKKALSAKDREIAAKDREIEKLKKELAKAQAKMAPTVRSKRGSASAQATA
jgi:uncharacterized coiled-coil protein SlyX